MLIRNSTGCSSLLPVFKWGNRSLVASHLCSIRRFLFRAISTLRSIYSTRISLFLGPRQSHISELTFLFQGCSKAFYYYIEIQLIRCVAVATVKGAERGILTVLRYRMLSELQIVLIAVLGGFPCLAIIPVCAFGFHDIIFIRKSPKWAKDYFF